MTLRIAALIRELIVPFLVAGTAAVALVLLALMAQRGLHQIGMQRQRRVTRRCGALVERVLEFGDAAAADALVRMPRRYHHPVGDLLLSPLRSITGQPADHARDLARRLGLINAWVTDLTRRRWWRRAAAARALGLVGEVSAHDLLVVALDDAHEEVRAAAVDGLGRLGLVSAVPALLNRLTAQSRHQRERIVEALRAMGPEAGPALLSYARAHPASLPSFASLLVVTAGAGAAGDLLTWCRDARTDVRAAAFGALGSIGLDDRGYYHALRALRDDDPAVRAMAARAIGRSGRTDAVPYLAPLLDDAWNVAAEGARALKVLAEDGRQVLRDRSAGSGAAAALSQHMLWEVHSAAVRAGRDSGL